MYIKEKTCPQGWSRLHFRTSNNNLNKNKGIETYLLWRSGEGELDGERCLVRRVSGDLERRRLRSVRSLLLLRRLSVLHKKGSNIQRNLEVATSAVLEVPHNVKLTNFMLVGGGNP